MKLKALRAGDAHSHEDEECRKRLRSARECAKAHSFYLQGYPSGDGTVLIKRQPEVRFLLLVFPTK